MVVDKLESTKIQHEHEDKKTISSLLGTVVVVFSRLLAIPVFLFAHKLFPNPDWAFHLDRIILLIVIFGITELLIKLIKNVVIIGLFISIIYLSYGSLSGSYGFSDLVKDYKAMLVSMYESPNPEKLIANKLVMYPNKDQIVEAINFDHPMVRDFALNAINKNFVAAQKNRDYRNIIQCFAIFKEINSRWNYVSDPKSLEYYARASESVQHLAGDCDDYSIVMAGSIKSIGGTARLVFIEGHIYPEMLIGNKRDMENLNYIIKRELFLNESRGKTLHFHIDENSKIWLNLDYTARYPGGPFMSDKNLGIIAI